jgi:hypothetical protein
MSEIETVQPQNQDEELDVQDLEDAAGGGVEAPGLEDDLNGNCGVNCGC